MASNITQSKFENSPKRFLKLLSIDQRKALKVWVGLEAKVINLFLNGQEVYTCCRTCKSKLDVTRPVAMKRGYCSPICGNGGRAHLKGTKRPKHAALMKVLIKKAVDEGRLWGKEHRKNNLRHLKQLNTSIDREAHSRNLKSASSKRRSLIRLIANPACVKPSLWKRSPLSKLTEAIITEASEVLVLQWSKMYSGLKTLTAMEKHPNMGASDGSLFKRIRVTNLKRYYQSKRVNVTVRSHLEYQFVQWLESSNHFKWRYEWTSVKTEFGFTKPDFKLYEKGQQPWVIELKGIFCHWRNEGLTPLKKILSVVAFCRRKGYRYAVLNQKQVKDCTPAEWVDLTQLNDRQVLKYLAANIPGAIDVLINRIS